MHFYMTGKFSHMITGKIVEADFTKLYSNKLHLMGSKTTLKQTTRQLLA